MSQLSQQAQSPGPARATLLQRGCDYGNGPSGLTGDCEKCKTKPPLGKTLQPKLRINEPGDEYEREADRVAKDVLAAPARAVNDALLRIRRVSSRPGGESTTVSASVDQVLASCGRPLEPALRLDMEQRFGHDFSRVRVHTDAAADRSARDVEAHAYTVGCDVVLGAGQYSPASRAGSAVLAYELMHVLQQSRSLPGEAAGKPTDGFPAIRNTMPATAIQRLKVTKPEEPAEAYIADVAELRAKFDGMSAAERARFLQPFLIEVLVNWQRAQSSGLTARLQGAPIAAAQMARNPAGPLAGIAHSGVESYAYRFQFSGTTIARQLVRGETTLADVAKTAESALRAATELRRLNDVLTRALSAETTSQVTGTPLADVLAIYRAEGGLGVPPSAGSLARGIPSGTKNEPALLRPPNLSHLVWLVDAQSVEGQDDDEIKAEALSHWFVQLGGLDEVGLLPNPKRKNFPQWSSKNWLAAADFDPSKSWTGGAASKAKAPYDAYQRWDAQMDNLELRRPGSAATGVSTAVMVAPRNPRTLISWVLSEAVMRHRAGGKLIPLLGALPAGNRYRELRTAIKGNLDLAALQTMLAKIAEIDRQLDTKPAPDMHGVLTADMPARMAGMWALMSAWLLADVRRLELLGDFVETAGTSVWSSCASGDFPPCGNMSRCNAMRAFYRTL